MAFNTVWIWHGLRFALLRLWRIYSGWWPVSALCVLALTTTQGWPLHKDLQGSWWLYSLNIDTLLQPIIWIWAAAWPVLHGELRTSTIVAASFMLASAVHYGIERPLYQALRQRCPSPRGQTLHPTHRKDS